MVNGEVEQNIITQTSYEFIWMLKKYVTWK